MAASIPDEIRKAITDVQPSMSAYLDAAANVERLAQTNHAAAANALPAFHASFATLSAAREQLAGRVTAMAADAEKNAVETARTDLAIVALAWLLAFIVVAAAGRITAMSIARALTRVKAAAHAIAEGDLSIRSDTPVDDDVGAVAGAVNRMADTLQTMIARLQAEQEQDAFSRQLSEILDMADTESDTYAVVARAMSAVSTDMPMELLVADSSRAHLERATVHPVAGASCCTVESPYGCMAVRRGNPIVFDTSETLNACARLRDRKTGPVSAVCVPLSFMGRSLGVLHATGAAGRPPEQRVISQLNTVGILAGSRIGTVRAFERTQVQASTDVLTGLLNRRSLESRVRRFDPAQDYAVVVADIDHFKRLNDTHGHEAGDRALRVFADVLRRSVREGDYTARWGGEEFMIVLEGRDARAALEVVDRIRENLRAACQIKGTPEITASYGVSDTSMDRTFEQLVRVADDALYQSKESGRNRVTIGDPLRVAGAVPRRDAEHLASIEVGELSPAQ
jgi:diguanylate cyclase (GGDEF)-like protein